MDGSSMYFKPLKTVLMRKVNLRHPLTLPDNTGLDVKKYRTLLKRIGFDCHKSMTGKDIELTDSGHVSFASIEDARKALESHESDSRFWEYRINIPGLRKDFQSFKDLLNLVQGRKKKQ